MKALIIGTDSGIGKALRADLLLKGHEVTGTTQVRENVRDDTFHLDLSDPTIDHTVLPNADVAYFCAAMTTYKACRENAELALRVNAEAPSAIAKQLVESGARVILLSTSAVLDCRSPCMTADRPRQAVSVYGSTKAQAELAFLALGQMASVLRLTKVLVPEDERFSKWISDLCREKSFSCPDDFRISPITMEHVVQVLIEISDQREGGIFQVSAASDISYAEAAWHTAIRINVPTRLVQGRSSKSLNIDADVVTAYTSLDATRLGRMFSFLPPDPRDVIDNVMGSVFAAARKATVLGA